MSKLFRFGLPLVVFIVLVIVFLLNLGKDPGALPSALITHAVPEFEAPSVYDASQVIRQSDLTGQVGLLNVWATWCLPCREEHPVLVEIAAASDVPIYGLNYKDNTESAVQWLKQLGDPYVFSFTDEIGDIGIDLGVYGVPETFVFDADGIIRYRYVGVLTLEAWEEELQPLIAQLQANT